MQDIDEDLRALFGQGPAAEPPDLRDRIRATARKRRQRRRALALGTATVVVAGSIVGLLSLRSDAPSLVTSTPDGSAEDQVLLSIPGIHDDVWISTGTEPVRGARDLGSIPVGGASITAAIETIRLDGTAVVILALTATGPVHAVEARPEAGEPTSTEFVDGRALLIVPLDEWIPALVVDVSTLDRSGAALDRVRVTPFNQNPLSCETNPQVVGGTDENRRPQYVPFQDAYLGPPLLASCDDR